MNNTHYNSAKITGRLMHGLQFSHANEKTKYYKGLLAVERTSGNVDLLPVVVPERTAVGLPDLTNKLVYIEGQISTYNKSSGGKFHLHVELFAHHIDLLDVGECTNEVILRGIVCKAPTFRVTPNGREICDVMIVVNRPTGRSSYIPCIAWGSDARTVSEIPVGEMIELHGRFQSRDYEKRMADGTVELRTAYEISAAKVVMEEK